MTTAFTTTPPNLKSPESDLQSLKQLFDLSLSQVRPRRVFMAYAGTGRFTESRHDSMEGGLTCAFAVAATAAKASGFPV